MAGARTQMEATRTKHDHGVSLPEDIIFDVLARLPAKTLCRLRCVCKGWRTLISDPAFIAAHRSHAADPHLVGVFNGARCGPPEVRVMDMDGNVVRAFKITRSKPQLQTRPELICADGDGLTRYGGMIIDPAAGQAFAAFGATHPSYCINYSTSIGRATPSGVIKALRLGKQFLMNDFDGGGGHQLCEVATIMDGNSCGVREPLTWRRRSAPPFDITDWCCENNAIVNGVIYFTHQLEIDGEVDEGDDAAPRLSYHIFAFDLEREEWKPEVINGPTLEHQEVEIWFVALVDLNGTLALVHEVIVNRYPYMSIWLLLDPGNSVWVKTYMIPMPKNHIIPAKPLGVLVDGRILLWSIAFEDEEIRQYNISFRCARLRKVVMFYDPCTKAFTDFVQMAEEFRLPLVFYNGSLLS